jgi:hypothetical protein
MTPASIIPRGTQPPRRAGSPPRQPRSRPARFAVRALGRWEAPKTGRPRRRHARHQRVPAGFVQQNRRVWVARERVGCLGEEGRWRTGGQQSACRSRGRGASRRRRAGPSLARQHGDRELAVEGHDARCREAGGAVSRLRREQPSHREGHSGPSQALGRGGRARPEGGSARCALRWCGRPATERWPIRTISGPVGDERSEVSVAFLA